MCQRLVINTEHRSPNFSTLQSDRKSPFAPGALLIHSTEGSAASSINWLCSAASKVSSHYLIDQNGKIDNLVPLYLVAWHAGVTALHGRENWNDFSIGIELERFGDQGYPNVQIDALTRLSKTLIALFGIPQQMVEMHRAVALPRGRKFDPVHWADTDFYAWSASLYEVPSCSC